LTAPDEPRLRELLARLDRELFRADGAAVLPLERRKMRWHIGVSPLVDGGGKK
jgi:hypothetical protein